MNSLAVFLLVFACGCSYPTIIMKKGKTWLVAKDHRGITCFVKDEFGNNQPAECELNAGDIVVPACSLE